MSNYIELLVTLGFLGALMWAMMKFMLIDIHRDMNDIKKEIHELKDDMHEIKQDMKVIHRRTDNLYEILIDLVRKKD